MSIRIALDNQPEFYTNLDHVAGRIVLALNRSEQVGSIVVKLEGESVTALKVPDPYNDGTGRPPGPMPGPPGSVVSENHKILYKVQQFKLPINNACSDPMAMSRIGGLAGVGGFGSGGGLFGMGGVRVMDGSKQLFLQHVTRTLPPSLTGYPNEAEIRYYIKVTVQRPGFLKENWRFQIGFKFLPIEPPRPAVNGQEAFARRPFAFRARAPTQQPEKKRSTFFNRKSDKGGGEPLENGSNGTSADTPGQAPAPSIEMSARLPHPPVLTCNQSVPLRLIAKKLVDSPEQVYLVSFQMDLIGITEVRSHNIYDKKINRWVVVSSADLSIPLTSSPQDPVGNEFVVPDELWKNRPLPNTVAPSFVACNLHRRYELELKIGLAWGKPKSGMMLNSQPQTIFLPPAFRPAGGLLGHHATPELLQAARNTKPGRVQLPPRLPPRTSVSGPSSPATSRPQQPQQAQAQAPPPMPPHPQQDPLYPPQLAPGQTVPPYDDAPPSYDEAIAENLAGPFDGLQSRPAYSGVTNENAPSQVPQKN
ncbi:hypothetical protein ACCO45_012928 [Purpureocillium lilacinum]|uniref:Uncharacterized protein n=1 Tax=Purpureocillium lilacinum TaxID=33203 RepID=A0ACC4DCE5_PURLI